MTEPRDPTTEESVEHSELGNGRTSAPIEPTPMTPAPPPRPRSGVAWLALILSLAALGWLGYQWWQAQQQTPEVRDDTALLASIDAKLDQQAQSLDADVERRLAAQQAQFEQALREAGQATEALQNVRAEVEALQAQLTRLSAEARTETTGLESRFGELETRLAQLTERDGRTAEVAEARALLRAASHLQAIGGDRAAALEAMRAAQQRLQEIDDPGHAGVRQALASEIAQAEAAPTIDAASVVGELNALSDGVGDWPLQQESRLAQANNLIRAEADDPGWWARAKSILADAVVVQRHAADAPEVVTLEGAALLRDNLRVQLSIAALAALRGDSTLYQTTLSRAQAWLQRYFATDAPAVRSAADTLERLAQLDLAPAEVAPGRALHLLEQVERARREAVQ